MSQVYWCMRGRRSDKISAKVKAGIRCDVFLSRELVKCARGSQSHLECTKAKEEKKRGRGERKLNSSSTRHQSLSYCPTCRWLTTRRSRNSGEGAKDTTTSWSKTGN